MTAEKVTGKESFGRTGVRLVEHVWGECFGFGQDIHRKLKKLRGTELLAVNISVKNVLSFRLS